MEFKNKVYVTKDRYLFQKRVEINNPIIIDDIKNAIPLPLMKDYTYLLISDTLDKTIFNLDVPIIQYMKSCDIVHEDIIYLKDFDEKSLFNSLVKKSDEEFAKSVLRNKIDTMDIDNELYKYRMCNKYKKEYRYLNVFDFCNDVMKGAVKYIPKFNVMLVSSVLFNKGNELVKEECLKAEHLIREGILVDNQLEYLVLRVRKAMREK